MFCHNKSVHLWFFKLVEGKNFLNDTRIHTTKQTHIRGSLSMFPDFFHIGTFIDSVRMKL